MFVFVSGVYLFYPKTLTSTFFYLTLPLADCANVAWKDGNSVTSSVSNHGSCCDTISLVVCLWLSTLTGKYEFVSLVSALWLLKLLANSSCAHLFFILFFFALVTG